MKDDWQILTCSFLLVFGVIFDAEFAFERLLAFAQVIVLTGNES
jgi:hypothetical protein